MKNLIKTTAVIALCVVIARFKSSNNSTAILADDLCEHSEHLGIGA